MQQTLKKFLDDTQIEYTDSSKDLKIYSHDASMFEIMPECVIFPKSSKEIGEIVKFVSEHKSKFPNLSITARSGGTDMSGGAINDSVILDFKNLNKCVWVGDNAILVEPGMYYRDFALFASKKNKFFPPYPASKDIACLGGMVANNCGGEKSLRYGKMQNFVQELWVVLEDGNEYHITPLNNEELDEKIRKGGFEGKLYESLKNMYKANTKVIQSAKPNVSKDSTGYLLWELRDESNDKWNLPLLFVGSQGTLGIIIKAKIRVVELPKVSGLLVMYLRNFSRTPQIATSVLRHGVESLECFDSHTLALSLKNFFSFRKNLGYFGLFKLAWSLAPNAIGFLRGLPAMIVMAEIVGESKGEISDKLDNLRTDLTQEKSIYFFEKLIGEERTRKFWLMRRESFKLLREKIKNKHTVPFMDDMCVRVEDLDKFLPEIEAVISKYNFEATVAGHLGNGNFHIIPLMDLSNEREREKIEKAMLEIVSIVKKYSGSISGEHNDGLIRGPFLDKFFSREYITVMNQVKSLFDHQNIFNPHKKLDATWEYSKSKIRASF